MNLKESTLIGFLGVFILLSLTFLGLWLGKGATSGNYRTCSLILMDNSTPRRGFGIKIEDAGSTCERVFSFCKSRDISLPPCKDESDYTSGLCHNAFFTETLFCNWDAKDIECDCIYNSVPFLSANASNTS